MILEGKWVLSGVLSAAGWTAQALTGLSAIDSTNIIDVGVGFGGQNINIGYPMQDLALVVSAQAASGGTNPTLKVDVVTADDAGFSVNSQVVASVTSGALKSGDLIVIPFPQSNRRYVKLVYTQTGTSPTNSVVASLTGEPQQWVSTADILTTSP